MYKFSGMDGSDSGATVAAQRMDREPVHCVYW